MTTAELIDWAFKGLLSVVGVYLTSLISQMRNSIDELNRAIAVEIEKATWLKESMDKQEKRLDKLEEKFLNYDKNKVTRRGNYDR